MYKLMIVDDNDIQIQSLLHYVSWEKYNITQIKTAYNGKEGLELYKKFKPDIIITDVVMPVMDGPEMVGEIRKISSEPKYIFMSCFDDVKYLQQAIGDDVYAYVLKPIDQNKLIECVEHISSKIREEKSRDRVLLESLSISRENFLYRMLYSKNMSIEYMEPTYRELQFDNAKFFCVAMFELIQYKDTFTDVYELMNNIKASLKNVIESVVAIESEARIAILFFDGSCDTLEEFFKKVHDELENQYKVSAEKSTDIKIGTSKPSELFYEIPTLAIQAATAIQDSLGFDNNMISVYEDDEYIAAEYNVIDIKESMIKIVDEKSDDKIDVFVDAYCPTDIKTDNIGINAMYIKAVAGIQLLLLDYELELKDIFDNNNIAWGRLNRFMGVIQFRRWLTNMLHAIYEKINSNNSKEQKQLVESMVDYINLNFRSITNIEQVAASVYISSSYARRIFKNVIGKTIFDYLIMVRMDEAKRLLSNPDVKIYKVASSIGYKSKPHFLTTFKQNVGMLPSEFRQGVLEKRKP